MIVARSKKGIVTNDRSTVVERENDVSKIEKRDCFKRSLDDRQKRSLKAVVQLSQKEIVK